jgi:hypothetical protein
VLTRRRVFLLRDPIPVLRCSPYARSAARLAPTSGRSRWNPRHLGAAAR